MGQRLASIGFSVVLLTACMSNTREEVSPQASSAVLTSLGMEYLQLGQVNVALEKLNKAIELNPDNAEAQDAIAVLFERIKEYGPAREHYEKALKLRPDSASTKNNFGRFLCERGEFETGIEYLKQAASMPLNDNKWFALTNLGRCELLEGKQDEAESHFRQALELQAKYAPALLEMQRIAYRQNKYLSARAFLQRYLEVAEHTAATLWVAFETEMSLENYQVAANYREELFRKFPNSNEAKQIQASGR